MTDISAVFFPPRPSLCWVLWRSSQSLTSSVGQLIPQRRRGRARIQSRLVWLLSSMPRKDVKTQSMWCAGGFYVSAPLFSPALSLRLMLWCRRCPAKVYFPEKETCLLRVGAPTGEFYGVAVLFWFLLALPEYLWLLGLENACPRLGLSVLSFISSCPSHSETPRTQQYRQH